MAGRLHRIAALAIAAHASFVRMFEVGLTLAVIVDATLVRMGLLPAFMHISGTWGWRAPGSPARLHERLGVSNGHVVAHIRLNSSSFRQAATVPASHAFHEGVSRMVREG
jgi:uncharacterized membrane protein YdfJ with MMPL/SSD domain